MCSSRNSWYVGLGRPMDCGPAANVRRLRVTSHEIGNPASFVDIDIALLCLRRPYGGAEKTLPRVEEVEKNIRRILSGDRGRSTGIGLMMISRLPDARVGVRKLIFPESRVESSLAAKDTSVFVQHALAGKLETSYSSFKHYSVGHVGAEAISYATISRECDKHIEVC